MVPGSSPGRGAKTKRAPFGAFFVFFLIQESNRGVGRRGNIFPSVWEGRAFRATVRDRGSRKRRPVAGRAVRFLVAEQRIQSIGQTERCRFLLSFLSQKVQVLFLQHLGHRTYDGYLPQMVEYNHGLR